MRRWHSKSLVLASRNLGTEQRRLVPWMLHIGILLGIFFALFATKGMMRFSNAPGRDLFGVIIAWNVVLITLFAFLRVSSVVVQEREEGTLPLLRMTGMTPLNLLIGNGLPAFISVLSLLIIQFPFWLLAYTLGGLRLTQIWTGLIILGAHYMLLSGFCLYISSGAATYKQAGRRVLIGVLIYPYGPYILNILDDLINIIPNRMGLARLDSLTPFSRVGDLFDVVGTDVLLHRIDMVQMLIGTAFFVLAWLRLRTGQNQSGVVLHLRRERKHRKRPRVGRANALAWKAFWVDAGGRKGMWIRAVLIYFVAAPLFFLRISDVHHYRVSNIAGTWFFVSVMFFWLDVCLGTTKLLSPELRQQTLESLSMLPTKWPRILRARLRALLKPVLLHIPFLLLLFGYLISTSNSARSEEVAIVFLFFSSGLAGTYIATALSLRMPFGMIPTAFVIVCCLTFLSAWLSFEGIGMRDEEVWAVITSIGWFVLCTILHRRIYTLTKQRAGRAYER